MKQDFTFLYIGTATMLFLSLCLIGFVIWVTWAMKKQRIFAEQRDRSWMDRIERVELLVKNEFQELLKALKL